MGIAGHGDDLKRIGRLAFKSHRATSGSMTTIALAIGLLAGNLVQPGVGVILPPPDPNAAAPKGRRRPSAGFLEHVVPQSFFEAAARNEVLQVVFWSVALRHRAHPGEGPAQGGHARLRRRGGGGDVQVRRHHHEVRADRHRRGDGGDRGPQRDRGDREPGQAGADTLRRADRVRARGAGAGGAASRGSRSAPSRGGEGPCGDRVHHHQLRRGAPAGDGADDRVRRPPAHRRLRHADRLLLQPRRVHPVPRRGLAVRGAGRGHPPEPAARSW